MLNLYYKSKTPLLLGVAGFLSIKNKSPAPLFFYR